MVKVRRTVILLALIMLGAPALLFGARIRAERVETRAAAQQVANAAALSRHTVDVGAVEVIVSAIGAIEPERSARISFRDPGRIAEVAVRVGDRVRVGDVLARQPDETQRLALEAAELGLAAAQLQKERLLTGPTESELAIAEANINAAIGAYNSIANAVSADAVRAAELQYQAAQRAVDDARARRATANGTPEQIALLEAQIGEASFNAEIARLSLDNARRGTSAQAGAAWARVRQAEAERDRLLAGATQLQIDNADAAIARAQIAVDRAREALSHTVITAPFDGLVSAVGASAGAIALPGVPIVTLVDVEPLRLKIGVDEIDVRQVRPGAEARVRVDAIRGLDLAARLERIALVPTVNGGIVTYDVEMAVLESDPRVRLGMTAEALIVVERREGVLVVPNEYIRLGRGLSGATVSVLNPDGTLSERTVTLGLQGDGVSEITSGLRAGEVVAVNLGGDAIFGLGG